MPKEREKEWLVVLVRRSAQRAPCHNSFFFPFFFLSHVYFHPSPSFSVFFFLWTDRTEFPSGKMKCTAEHEKKRGSASQLFCFVDVLYSHSSFPLSFFFFLITSYTASIIHVSPIFVTTVWFCSWSRFYCLFLSFKWSLVFAVNYFIFI